MRKTPINRVVAENLKYFMEASNITTQPALAAQSGMAQRTIGNYLNPDLRRECIVVIYCLHV